jgi:hypothetical protein
MIYQEHGHRGIWSMSIAAVDRSPDKKKPDTVDEDPYPRDSEGASLHRGCGNHVSRLKYIKPFNIRLFSHVSRKHSQVGAYSDIGRM